MLLHCHVKNISVAWRMSLGSGRNMLDYKGVDSYLVLKYKREAINDFMGSCAHDRIDSARVTLGGYFHPSYDRIFYTKYYA